MYIPDPTEILERQMETQMDLIDENDTYPCAKCGRRFNYEEMGPVSIHPASPLECGRDDCAKFEKEQAND